jgi:hypothetical protein
MPNLLPVQTGSSSQVAHGPTPKEHMTATGVFLSVLLAFTLIGLGERLLYDLNRLNNPHYRECNPTVIIFSRGSSCAMEQYAFKQVLLHSYVSFPLFVLFLALVLYLRHHRLATWQKALFRASGAVSIFFGVQFLAEMIIYLFRFHRLVGVYVSYGLGAILLATLIVYIERREAKRKAAAHNKR